MEYFFDNTKMFFIFMIGFLFVCSVIGFGAMSIFMMRLGISYIREGDWLVAAFSPMASVAALALCFGSGCGAVWIFTEWMVRL